MARISRSVVPGYPHHVTQRGVRSMEVFDSDEDRWAYLNFLSEEANRFVGTYGVMFDECLNVKHDPLTSPSLVFSAFPL